MEAMKECSTEEIVRVFFSTFLLNSHTYPYILTSMQREGRREGGGGGLGEIIPIMVLNRDGPFEGKSTRKGNIFQASGL